MTSALARCCTLGVILCLAGSCQQQPVPPMEIVLEPLKKKVVSFPIPVIEPTVVVVEQPDLWRSILRSFALEHDLDQRSVRQELKWLERHPQYIERLKPRIARYLGYIHGQVVARGLPGELALLPIVESALDPYAFSHGGAAGLWQFMPATAKRFGLERNWWYDGRRDVVASTRAALDYLEYLHGLFDDWQLAVAGYNAGEGNVRRAVRKARAASKQSTGEGEHFEPDFWSLPLPRETRAYVPRLLALAALLSEPERYGVSVPVLDPELPFAIIDTHGQFDLMKVAETLSLSIDTLYEWNPSLNQWATPPDGPHRLLLPVAVANTVESSDADDEFMVTDAQRLISAVPADQRVRWLRIKVRSGDTLSHIARRYHTDVATVRRANDLVGTSIRAGQALLIPKSVGAQAANPVATRAPGGKRHVVKSGDSLWTLSRSYGVPLTSIVKANHIGPKELIRPGQTLTIPGGSGQRSDVIRKVNYGVRRGDSLARIASKFNVLVSEIAQWNQLNVNQYLQPGQSLLLYVNVVAGGE